MMIMIIIYISISIQQLTPQNKFIYRFSRTPKSEKTGAIQSNRSKAFKVYRL